MNPHLRRKRTTVLNKKKLTEKKSFCFLFSPGAGAGAGAVPHFEKKPVPQKKMRRLITGEKAMIFWLLDKTLPKVFCINIGT